MSIDTPAHPTCPSLNIEGVSDGNIRTSHYVHQRRIRGAKHQQLRVMQGHLVSEVLAFGAEHQHRILRIHHGNHPGSARGGVRDGQLTNLPFNRHIQGLRKRSGLAPWPTSTVNLGGAVQVHPPMNLLCPLREDLLRQAQAHLAARGVDNQPWTGLPSGDTHGRCAILRAHGTFPQLSSHGLPNQGRKLRWLKLLPVMGMGLGKGPESRNLIDHGLQRIDAPLRHRSRHRHGLCRESIQRHFRVVAIQTIHEFQQRRHLRASHPSMQRQHLNRRLVAFGNPQANLRQQIEGFLLHRIHPLWGRVKFQTADVLGEEAFRVHHPRGARYQRSHR